MVVVGDWDQYEYLMNRDIEDILKYFSRHSSLSLWFVPEADCWVGARRLPGEQSSVCFEDPTKREIMALASRVWKLLDFKRNFGLMKRGRDLLPVRPCRLQADNNDAHLLPEIWLRNWRSRTFVRSMVSFVDLLQQFVEVPKTVSQDRIQQRTLEQISDTPVPQVVEELVEVITVFVQDRVQQRFAEQIFATPAISPTEVFNHVSQDRVQQRFLRS